MSKSKISTFQFFSMLFLTRLLTTFTYIPSYTKDIELSDLVVQAVLRYLICVVMMIPVYFLFKRNHAAVKAFAHFGSVIRRLVECEKLALVADFAPGTFQCVNHFGQPLLTGLQDKSQKLCVFRKLRSFHRILSLDRTINAGKSLSSCESAGVADH